MKIVREHINEKFTEDSDPIQDLGIGLKLLIEKWFLEINKTNGSNYIINYIINDDFTIDLPKGFYYGNELKNLPKYINFNNVNGDFTLTASNLESLRGFPKIINGNLYLGKNELTSLEYCPKKISYSLMLFKNDLISLKYCPSIINLDFNISNNKNLTSLDYMPSHIRGNFICYNTGMSDNYIHEYLLKNRIHISGKKIISIEDAKRNNYVR